MKSMARRPPLVACEEAVRSRVGRAAAEGDRSLSRSIVGGLDESVWAGRLAPAGVPRHPTEFA